MELHVKYFDPSIPPLKRIFVGDWIDLRTREDVVMECGTYRNIPLNVAIKLPDGYEAIMAPRSSTFKNFGILMTNGSFRRMLLTFRDIVTECGFRKVCESLSFG